jgi:hypothetical protein
MREASIRAGVEDARRSRYGRHPRFRSPTSP